MYYDRAEGARICSWSQQADLSSAANNDGHEREKIFFIIIIIVTTKPCYK